MPSRMINPRLLGSRSSIMDQIRAWSQLEAKKRISQSLQVDRLTLFSKSCRKRRAREVAVVVALVSLPGCHHPSHRRGLWPLSRRVWMHPFKLLLSQGWRRISCSMTSQASLLKAPSKRLKRIVARILMKRVSLECTIRASHPSLRSPTQAIRDKQ